MPLGRRVVDREPVGGRRRVAGARLVLRRRDGGHQGSWSARACRTQRSGPSDDRGRAWRRAGWVLFFLAPSAVPLVMFTAVPMVSSVWVSLHEWNLISPMEWVGSRQLHAPAQRPGHAAGLPAHPDLRRGYLPLVYTGGLGLALALNQKLAGPVVLPGGLLPAGGDELGGRRPGLEVAAQPPNGLVNTVLGGLGLRQPGWWTDPTWALPSVILASAWKDLGFVMVILLAGLQAIPADVQRRRRSTAPTPGSGSGASPCRCCRPRRSSSSSSR